MTKREESIALPARLEDALGVFVGPAAITEAIDALRHHLSQHGDVDDKLLAHAWDDFVGSDATAMASRKLGRRENTTWEEPIMTFVIERHGGTVNGSTRAELQRWRLDLDAGTAEIVEVRPRQLTPMRARLDVRALALALVERIERSEDDPRLEWSPDRTSVRILTTLAINPEGNVLFRATEDGRRKRLRTELVRLLPELGWQEYAPARWRMGLDDVDPELESRA